MPSGPKKRKASKKKKEANLIPPSHAYGDEDLEHLESKECHHNGGGAPPSQDHHSNLDQFTEDEKLGENPVVGGLQSNENNGEKLGKEEMGNSSVKREVDVEDIIIKENGRYEHEEVGRNIDEEDQCNCSVNGGLTERDDVNNEDEGRSEDDVNSSSNGAEDKPFETKNAEHLTRIDSANVEVREALHDKEKDTSQPEKNHTPLVIEHVGETKTIVMDEKVDVSAVRIAALIPKEMVLKDVDTTVNEAKVHGVVGAIPNEPSMVAAPGPLQKTSWKCCCGLFELFTRSGW